MSDPKAKQLSPKLGLWVHYIVSWWVGGDNSHFWEMTLHTFIIFSLLLPFFWKVYPVRQVQKRGGKGEKSKKGKVKGKGGSPLSLSPQSSLSFSLPPSPSPFEASYTDIRTAHLLLLYYLRNLREGSFEDGEGVRHRYSGNFK